MLRKILSVVAGYAAWTALWLVAGAVVPSLFAADFGEDGGTRAAAPLLVLLAWSVLCSLVAGWLAALVARGEGRTVLWTGALLLLTGLGVEIGSWALVPAWYHVVFLFLLLPVTVVGGLLRAAPGATRLAAQP